MKHGVISVVVPVYNVEKYLAECIESIIGQTYTNLEIILIDDSSPDRCGEICDRYARMDSRIIVIHQKNGGAAAARNAGLRIATGEYITFVDSDDFLCPDAYAHMLAAITRHDADIVHGGFLYTYVNGSRLHHGYDRVRHFTTTEYLEHFLKDWTCALCWDKLFRRHVLDHLLFEEGHLVDDEFFTYQAVLKAKKIVGIPHVTYNYRQRASSVMKNPATIERKAGDVMDFLKKRRDQVIAAYPELRYPYEGHYVDTLIWLTRSAVTSKATIRRVKKRLLEFVAEGRMPFWKGGYRKRGLQIFALLMKRPERILKNREEGANESEYELFE